ncbi:hypothetical protein RGF97_09580 [Streptomyces roseicoloratus]|uniref:DNA-binding protein n=1 Tax=Streptomyces roseicoloratus TaxID=2508722 RepID=A0ABY9RS91_9ACTN|nr:helix-turn-helix domain-containing protein [Streptomyces roseicoloratus]WMX45052.1 hypothetical protein RGF97_09580 [Streptomyces roseicoloratus]
MIHVRHRHTERFTVVGNHLAQHAELSAAAIGIAVYIQSLPDGVSVTAKSLALRFREGETTVRRALNELERAGYIARPRIALGGGRFATRTFSYDKPCCVPAKAAAPAPPPVRKTQDQAQPSKPCLPPQPPAAPPPLTTSPADDPTSPTADSTGPADDPAGPAADLLAGLRLADPRLFLSVADVRRLAPAVDTWLGRSATPAQITRTLTARLPPEPVPIHHPARFVEYRLTHLLPPPLPVPAVADERRVDAPPPLITCDGCERGIRSHDPNARCADCRAETEAEAWAQAEAEVRAQADAEVRAQAGAEAEAQAGAA